VLFTKPTPKRLEANVKIIIQSLGHKQGRPEAFVMKLRIKTNQMQKMKKKKKKKQNKRIIKFF
jgi:hypothetical protein